ncbi:MAG: RNA 2',3'-cyclic phosphodiesterase, partial [Nitrosomonas sp.]|nr:RNA 2',3'-cyclic phosphodiesterase [Nitrosomonas sp.]
MHLTLAFLGNVTIERLPELKITANNVAAKAFNLTIEEIGYWKHPQIIYAMAKSYPTALLTLTESLRKELSKAEFVFDSQTFNPHVTLIRKAKCLAGPRLTKPIRWHAKEWRLIQSKQTNYGVDYIPLQRWLLE